MEIVIVFVNDETVKWNKMQKQLKVVKIMIAVISDKNRNSSEIRKISYKW